VAKQPKWTPQEEQREVLHRELAQAYERMRQLQGRIAVLEAKLAQLDARLNERHASKQEASE